MTEICITADEWRIVLARCYPEAVPGDILTREDGALFFGLVGGGSEDRAGQYLAAFFPAYSYGFVEVPR